LNIQINLNHEKLTNGQTSEELARKCKIGFLLLAYLKAELSLGELAELMDLEYIETRTWLTQLGIPLMRQKSPEIEHFMQKNLQRTTQWYKETL